MNNTPTPDDITTSREFEASVARRALLLGAANLSRILPSLDATQSQILSRGMNSLLGLGPTGSRLDMDQFQAAAPPLTQGSAPASPSM